MGGVQKAANKATTNISPKAVGSMGGKGGAAPMPTRPQMPPQVQPPMGGMNPKGGGMPMPPQRPPMGGMNGKGVSGPMPPMMPPQRPPMGGMGGKGVGMPMPPQVKPGMGGKGGGMPGGTLVGFGPTDMPIYSNDPNAVPYTGPSMGGAYKNGVPVIQAPQVPSYAQPGGMNGKGGTSGQIDPAMAAYARALQGQQMTQLNPQQQQNAMQYGNAYYGEPQRTMTPAEMARSGLSQTPQQSGLAGLGRFGGMF